MSKFYAGQKVVCIADYSKCYDEDWAILIGIQFPDEGEIYTVREVTVRAIETGDDAEEQVAIMLEELLNLEGPCYPSLQGGMHPVDGIQHKEIAWHQDDFRPVLTAAQKATAWQTENA